MPHTVHFAPAGAEARFSGCTTGREIYDANEEFWTHAYDDGLHFGLFDFAEVTTLEVTSADVRSFADQALRFSTRSPGAAIAIVAPGTLVYGLARMWEAMAEGAKLESRVFQGRDAALEWLRGQGFAL